jgi:hypothetical protein
MICAKCKADIEFDSFFCDQCGVEILICPTCRNPKTGKVCTSDGTKLVTAKDFAAMKNAQSNITSKTEVVPDKPIISTPSQPAPQVTSTQAALSTSGVPELKFVNNSLNLTLKLNHEDIIGRKQGPFTPLLSSYNQLSGKHVQIKYLQGAGWNILDLNSSNGTTYNGKKLEPMLLYPLVNNTKIILANIEFLVQITSDEVDLDKTVRI